MNAICGNGANTQSVEATSQGQAKSLVHPALACAGGTAGFEVVSGNDHFRPSSNIQHPTSDIQLVEFCEDGPPAPPDEWRIAEANRRQQILQAFAELLARGLSRTAAVKELGESYTSVWRWEKRFKAEGFNGLIPDTDKCGRKSVFEKLGMTQEQIAQTIADLQGLNLDLNSGTSSLRVYAQSDRCPPALAEVILNPNRSSKHALPPSLREAAKVDPNQRKAHAGPRTLSLGGIYTPRKMDVLPGDIFSADDTTPIWAWWVPWYVSDEYPFGVKLLQGQFIPVIDVASQCCLTYVIIAREKSSYRAADIWRLFGHTFDQVGLPRLGWQLERGSWEANVIRGQEVTYQEGEITLSRRVGGLRQLPSNVTEWHRDQLRQRNERQGNEAKDFLPTLQTYTSYLPKSKSIESFFNRSQTFEGTLWGALGRDQMRAPFEKAKKKFQECQRGAADPREHFLSYAEMCSRLNGLLNYVNREPMEGEVFYGVPEQRFAQAIEEYPLMRLPDELRHLYARDWTVVTITNGWARVRLTDPIEGRRYSLFYCNPAVFAGKEGEQVAVYYDREKFEEPAQIILARTGEYLCAAGYEDRKGSFLEGDASGHDVRKLWRNAVMSAYGTLVKYAPSRQLPPEIAARREAAKGNIQHPTSNNQHPMTDGRPRTALLVAPAPSPEDRQRNREELSRQAALANRLRALQGTME